MRSLILAALLSITGVLGQAPTQTTSSVVNRPTSKYEYIVVGSGPGGAPLAAGLAKLNFSVLLVEAGDDQSTTLSQQVPGLNLNATNDPNARWDYFVKHDSSNSGPYNTWKTSDGKYSVGSTG